MISLLANGDVVYGGGEAIVPMKGRPGWKAPKRAGQGLGQGFVRVHDIDSTHPNYISTTT